MRQARLAKNRRGYDAPHRHAIHGGGATLGFEFVSVHVLKILLCFFRVRATAPCTGYGLLFKQSSQGNASGRPQSRPDTATPYTLYHAYAYFSKRILRHIFVHP